MCTLIVLYSTTVQTKREKSNKKNEEKLKKRTEQKEVQNDIEMEKWETMVNGYQGNNSNIFLHIYASTFSLSFSLCLSISLSIVIIKQVARIAAT